MSYLVYARKYRPKTFEEMIGQKAVVQTLQNAVKNGRVAQAYLFSGMRGVGKTTAARILAKALNCEKGPTPTPCNQCQECIEITEDRSLDVMEIDGASNRGIDDIRALRDSVRYKPARGRRRIIIIDEVHMLTKEAFNALLKTLEEPPPDTVFIFATTEFHKVLPTIVSRCQHFEFKKVSPVELIAHLREVVEKEKLTVSPFGLGLIAAAADGSVRDAQSLLDQAVAFCGTTIGDAELKEILGAVSGELLFEFSSAMAEARAGDIFALVEKVIEAGHDLRFFYKEFIEHVRGLLLVKTVEKPQELLLFAAQDLDRLKAEAEKASAEDWLRWLQALQAAEGGLKFASHPQIFFETVLVRLCHFGRIVPIQDLLQEVAELKKSAGPADEVRRVPAGPAPVPAPKFSLSRSQAPSPDAKAPGPAAAPSRTAPGPAPAAPPRKAEPAAPAPAERSRRQENEREQAFKDPGVRQVIDRLKGQVLNVEKTGSGRDEPEE